MAVSEVDRDQKLKYPKSVFFIICNEFCERFSYYGMRTVLSFYLVDILLYTQTMATVIYHTFTMFAYFFPLLGAMLADSYLGKYRTILYLSVVYAAGQLLLAVSSVPPLGLPVREFSILGLLMIALGTGGIKPCVAAFGGDQFKLPQQEHYLAVFFSLFYFSINSGSLISTAITPVLRKEVTCYGMTTCYPLAFLVPAVLMTVSIVIFFAGKRLYKIRQPEGNVVVKVVLCISHAIGRKIKSKGKREHWLDYSDDKYDRHLIEDIKSVLKVLVLFVPLPFFWALFDQQGSRWTFQASRMDGEVFGYLIKPDQFQVINPLFIVIFIPVFQWAIYPILEKFLYLNTPLRKMTAGGILAGLSFIISAIVELNIEPTYAVQPSQGLAQIRIFNTINCPASLTLGSSTNKTSYSLEALNMIQDLYVPVNNSSTVLTLDAKYTDCKQLPGGTLTVSENLTLVEKTATSWALTIEGLSPPFADSVEKSGTGDPFVRALIYKTTSKINSTINFNGEKENQINITKKLQFTEFDKINHNPYNITLDGKPVEDNVFFRFGGVYNIIGYASDTDAAAKTVTLADPNSVHMFWLMPQYVVITMGEIMFSITGLEFAFTQAPVTMKSLLQASWLLSVAFGNLIVVIIAEAAFFDRQVFEFFLFAGLMFVDMIIFAIMARCYKYVEPVSNNESVEDIHLQTKNGIGNENYSEDL
ncbi:peptide transporter family 1 [Nasonia vitripennis]|uniref:Oligopeptide transporter 1 n=1 Tax=Nasonia vitripennis TaxID=7425 RepID=A0A7M7G4B4_NASVI|nr:peptide transporter family 1 [Nasonia vitripennis]